MWYGREPSAGHECAPEIQSDVHDHSRVLSHLVYQDLRFRDLVLLLHEHFYNVGTEDPVEMLVQEEFDMLVHLSHGLSDRFHLLIVFHR